MITKKDLLNWLKKTDNKLKKKITLIAVGGTAMTLLNFKESTIDVDFDVGREDHDLFKNVIDKTFRVDIFVDGYIFSEQLPDDYAKIAFDFKNISFKKINLKILHPMDIILTKTARYNARDEDDIAALVKKIKINKEELKSRFEKILGSYAGSESIFRDNFEAILKRHFKD